MPVFCGLFGWIQHPSACNFNSVQKIVSKAVHEKPWHIEGMDTGEWILMDFVDIVVHIFQKQTRSHYDIESLWGDAKQTLVESKY